MYIGALQMPMMMMMMMMMVVTAVLTMRSPQVVPSAALCSVRL